MGNRNAHTHGLYSKRNAEAYRRVISGSAGLDGLDLDIALALWQSERVFAAVPDRELLHDSALRKLFGLVRRKYGFTRRDDDELMPVIFIRLCFDLVFTADLQSRLAAATSPKLRADSRRLSAVLFPLPDE